VLRTRESLALLRVREDVLCIHTLLWPEEVRPTAGLAPEAPAPDPREMEMARTLLDQLGADFDWSAHHDQYRHALEQVIQARLADTEPPHAPPAHVMPAEVVDLMAVLEASVQAAKASRTNENSQPNKGS
jgi:DNA end-binding protein Ku